MSIQTDLSQAQQAQATGNIQEAISLYQRVLQRQSTHNEALHGLGLIALQQQNYAQAIRYFEQILQAHPSHAGTLNNRAISYFESGHISLAQKDWEAALKKEPQQASYWFNLGRCYQAFQTTETHLQAQKCFQKAIACRPDYDQAWNSLGNVLAECGKTKKALHAYQKAVAYQPSNLDAQVNMAVSYVEIHKPATARRMLEKMTRELPDAARALYNLGLLEMQAGELQLGLEHYEKYRWANDDFIRPLGNLPLPLWKGEQVDRLLICHEQGFGDSIQFVRYLVQASRYTSHLYLEVPAPLVLLMQSLSLDLSCPLTVIPEGEPLPDVNAWAPMLRLLWLFSAHLFAEQSFPYFQVKPALLSEASALKVGVVWATGYRAAPRLKKLYHRKSVKGQHMQNLAKTHDEMSFYSFQVGPEAQPLPEGVHAPLLSLDSFYDTACALQTMDLVITVDTAVAHLAGALNRPTWVLVPSVADWRWGFEGEYTSWYPENMRVFRQKPEDLDWSGVFCEVEAALQAFRNA